MNSKKQDATLAGYRLIYEVDDNEITVLILGVGKRDKDKFNKTLKNQA